MKARGITNPWDLTEFDQWVNDATRKDIEKIVAAQQDWKVFGLEMWREWEKTRGRDLQGALNFSVDYIFKNEAEAKVDALIQQYKKAAEENRSTRLDSGIVDKLSKLAIHVCWWV